MVKKDIGRREFLQKMGMAGAVVSGVSLVGCTSDKNSGQKWSVEGTGGEPAGEMTYRTTPNTGDKVSILGYGCMRWPMTKDENDKDIVDQEKVNELVDHAIAHGVNYFDTAPVYLRGKSETATGIALKRHPREKYFIATKMSNFGSTDFDFCVKMYRDSFKNLQVDYIDYYLLHSIGGGKGIETFNKRFIENGLLDFLLEEREAGRIRNLGFSYHGDINVFNRLLAEHDKYKWNFVQIQMNYLDWKYAQQINPRNTNAEYLYNEVAKRDIPIIIMEPLLGGRLSNVPDNIVPLLKQREPEKSVASWAFRFAGTYPKVLTVLSGMTRKEHLQDNLVSYSPLQPLSEEDLDFLQEIADKMMKYDTIPCNDCKYCMPCPYGIDIPAILLHYNKCLNEGNILNSSQDNNYHKARREYLIGYDRSVPKLRQANHCIGCDQCSPHCPQRIDIPSELHRIDEYVEKLKQSLL